MLFWVSLVDVVLWVESSFKRLAICVDCTKPTKCTCIVIYILILVEKGIVILNLKKEKGIVILMFEN